MNNEPMNDQRLERMNDEIMIALVIDKWRVIDPWPYWTVLKNGNFTELRCSTCGQITVSRFRNRGIPKAWKNAPNEYIWVTQCRCHISRTVPIISGDKPCGG
jgi:hypothetical protein